MKSKAKGEGDSTQAPRLDRLRDWDPKWLEVARAARDTEKAETRVSMEKLGKAFADAVDKPGKPWGTSVMGRFFKDGEVTEDIARAAAAYWDRPDLPFPVCIVSTEKMAAWVRYGQALIDADPDTFDSTLANIADIVTGTRGTRRLTKRGGRTKKK